MLKAKLLAGGGEEPLFSDSVFSAFTYTGNGSTQTITNGIDLAGKGGLVWTKCRSAAINHGLTDTVTGAAKYLKSNSADGSTAAADSITSFSATGYSLGADTVFGGVNTSPYTYASWTFAKAPKFFDVVTYTGNGTAGRTIAHSLGVAPGMIIIKDTSAASDWGVYHRNLTNETAPWVKTLFLNTTAAQDNYRWFHTSSEQTASVFTIGAAANTNGNSYVAYLFAHDTATDGIVQCGSFTTDGSGNATVSLGWEPQYLLIKSSSNTANWAVTDSSRGMTVHTGTAYNPVLVPNSSAAESTSGESSVMPTATGFYTDAATMGASRTYIYLAIRRPNKPPTVGTQVFSPNTATGTDTVSTGFPVDMQIQAHRPGDAALTSVVFDRLRGVSTTPTAANTPTIQTSSTGAETTAAAQTKAWSNTGFTTAMNSSITWNFKRAVGVFDVVCYTGTSVANRQVQHGLGVVPELIILKSRSGVYKWCIHHKDISTNLSVYLDSSVPVDEANNNFSATPTTSVFTVDSLGGLNAVNSSSHTYVAYLFATVAGVSKVGSYTGTATTLAIDCGFTTGARFVLIKRTDSTGDWYVWDTVRGIIAGNDPYLLLNSTAAEVTSTDYIDSYTPGFELSSTAPAAINASGGTFIYLAFA